MPENFAVDIDLPVGAVVFGGGRADACGIDAEKGADHEGDGKGEQRNLGGFQHWASRTSGWRNGGTGIRRTP